MENYCVYDCVLSLNSIGNLVYVQNVSKRFL